MMELDRTACKFDFGWGSAPDPAGGAYSIPPDSLPAFKGLLLAEVREGMGGSPGSSDSSPPRCRGATILRIVSGGRDPQDMKWIQRKRREMKGKERGKRVKRKRGVEGGRRQKGHGAMPTKRNAHCTAKPVAFQ